MKLFGRSNHIKIYDNALSKKECQILINQFEKLPQDEGGVNMENGYGIDHGHKKCMEMKDTNFSNKSIVTNILRVSINKHIQSKINNEVKKTFEVDFIDENISVKPIDYYYTNSIARSSKVMSECRQISKKFLFTGIEKAS